MEKVFNKIADLGIYGIVVFYILAPGFWIYGLYWSFTHNHIVLGIVNALIPPFGSLVGLWAVFFG